MLAALVERSREHGCTRIVGFFRPTAKNGMVKTFYESHGFRRAGEADGEIRWELANDVDSRIKPPAWITTTITEKAYAG